MFISSALINPGPVDKHKLDKFKNVKIRMPSASGRRLRFLTFKTSVLYSPHTSSTPMVVSHNLFLTSNYLNTKSLYQLFCSTVFISSLIMVKFFQDLHQDLHQDPHQDLQSYESDTIYISVTHNNCLSHYFLVQLSP